MFSRKTSEMSTASAAGIDAQLLAAMRQDTRAMTAPAAAIAVAEVDLPEPLPVKSVGIAAQAELIGDLGMSSNPAYVRARIDDWLAEKEIKKYNLEGVYRFLASKAEKEFVVTHGRKPSGKISDWGTRDTVKLEWRPLREFDSWFATNKVYEPWVLGRANWNDAVEFSISTSVYALPVPFSVLRLVRDIERDLGREHLSFFVSDYRVVQSHPDPFLAVAPSQQRSELSVIAHWDEPDFNG